MIGTAVDSNNPNRQDRGSATVVISPAEDVKTMADLEANPQALVEQARKTGRPVVIAETGKASVVLLSAERFEWLVHCRNLARLLHEGEESIRKEGTQPAEEVFKELLKKSKRQRQKPAARKQRAKN